MFFLLYHYLNIARKHEARGYRGQRGRRQRQSKFCFSNTVEIWKGPFLFIAFGGNFVFDADCIDVVVPMEVKDGSFKRALEGAFGGNTTLIFQVFSESFLFFPEFSLLSYFLILAGLFPSHSFCNISWKLCKL